MADAMQYEFPVSDSKEKSSGSIDNTKKIPNNTTEEGLKTDLPEMLGESTPKQYTIDEYYKDDDLGKEVLQNKYLAPWEKILTICGKELRRQWQMLKKM